jgi:YVTN family beta-propeller protein
VSVIDTNTKAVIATLPVGVQPMGIAMTPDGVSAYVANQGSNSLSIIDTAQRTVIDIPYTCLGTPDCKPTDIAISPDGTFALVTNFSFFRSDSNSVTQVLIPGLSSSPFLPLYPTFYKPTSVAFSSTGQYAITHAGGQIYAADPGFVFLSPDFDFVAGQDLSDVAFSPDGAFAYVTDSEDPSRGPAVEVIGTSTGKLVARIPIDCPERVAVTPDGAFLYVTSCTDTVSIIDTSSRSTLTVSLGDPALGIAVTPDGDFAYAATQVSNKVSVIDTRTHLVPTAISVGNRPNSIVIADPVPLVMVGDPGNLPDFNSLGAVGYVYHIGVTEVTNSQYAAFLNSVAASDPGSVYNAQMGNPPLGGIMQSGSPGSFTYAVMPNMGNKPVNFVSWTNAARYANWLNNGRPTGAQNASTTENGAYDLSVPNPEFNAVRSASATWALPTNDEWYKAAYFDPTRGGSNYWLYPTRSDAEPTIATADSAGSISNPGANVANYAEGANWNGTTSGNVCTVRSAGLASRSFYGTFDQGGNVMEWTEGLSGSSRLLRGGGFDASEVALQAHAVSIFPGVVTQSDIGLRVVQIAPSTPPKPTPSPTPTQAPLGCCALSQSSCLQTTQLGCAFAGGTFFGPPAVCQPNGLCAA